MRKLIRCDGTERQIDAKVPIMKACEMIRADFIDTVSLKDGVHVMIVDDVGHRKDLPVNRKATDLYWEKCGRPVDHVIRGDVLIVPDGDYE